MALKKTHIVPLSMTYLGTFFSNRAHTMLFAKKAVYLAPIGEKLTWLLILWLMAFCI